MNVKIIALPFLLAACSSTSLQDTQPKDPPPVESRTTRNSTGSTRNANVIVNANPEPVVEVRRTKIADRADPNTFFQNKSIYFDLDEYTVKKEFIPLLKQHAEFLIKNPNEFVFIEGHTDERGGKEYNLSLGQKRANAVRVELMKYGAKDSQLEAYSYGSEKPKALGSTEEAWSQNRRVDLYYRN